MKEVASEAELRIDNFLDGPCDEQQALYANNEDKLYLMCTDCLF